MQSGVWLTWANLLTLTRVIVLVPLAYALLNAQWMAAAALFMVGVITDIYDGKVARHLQQTSPIGGLFDHATDAVFVTLGSGILAYLSLINEWLPFLIPLAFVQYMLDSKALSGVALRTSALGRVNGIAYYVVIGAAIGAQFLQWELLQSAVAYFAWLLVLTTVISMVDRAITLARKGLRPS